jgi:hypothetical protein
LQFDFVITSEKVKLLPVLFCVTMLSNQLMDMETKPVRIKRSAALTVQGKIENVFPLFGPIREKEWAEGWEPEILYRSGDVLVEEHMIFQTNGQAGEGKYLWTITQYQPKIHLIEYTVSTQERIWFIRVQCEPVQETTAVTVSYTYTGLTEAGNRQNEQALKRMFAHDLKDWEEAINYYLKTGKQLTTP